MKKGFTLIELMIVIAIIAILMVVAIPKIRDDMRGRHDPKGAEWAINYDGKVVVGYEVHYEGAILIWYDAAGKRYMSNHATAAQVTYRDTREP